MRQWILIMFDSHAQEKIVKIMYFSTMRELAYVVGVKPQYMSNVYHGLVKPRGIIKYLRVV